MGSNIAAKGFQGKIVKQGGKRASLSVPLWTEKALDRWPLTPTLALGLAYKESMKALICVLIPKTPRTTSIKSQATLSNGFSASTARKKPLSARSKPMM